MFEKRVILPRLNETAVNLRRVPNMGEFETLTFEDFAGAVEAVLGEVYGNASVYLHEVIKNNDKRLQAITILESDKTNMAPAIYLEGYYKEYLSRGFTESVNGIIEAYEQNKIKDYADLSFLTSYEKVKGRLAPRLINHEKNMQILKGTPHIRFLDLAVAFHYLLVQDGGFASVLVTHALNETWGKQPAEELFKDAIQNLERSVCVMPLLDEVRALTAEFEGALEQEDECIRELCVLSNNSRFYGASALLSEKTLRDFADNTECGKVIILPSSIHEVLLLPMRENYDPKELKEMVTDINGSKAVLDEEILSDNVYVYDRESETTSIA